MADEDSLASLGGTPPTPPPTPNPNVPPPPMAVGGAMPPGSPAMGGTPVPPQGGVPGQQPQIDPKKLAAIKMLMDNVKLNTGGKIHGVKKEAWSILDPITQDKIRTASIPKKLQLTTMLDKSAKFNDSIKPGKSYNPPKAKEVLEAFAKLLGLSGEVEDPYKDMEKNESGMPMFPNGTLGAPSGGGNMPNDLAGMGAGSSFPSSAPVAPMGSRVF